MRLFLRSPYPWCFLPVVGVCALSALGTTPASGEEPSTKKASPLATSAEDYAPVTKEDIVSVKRLRQVITKRHADAAARQKIQDKQYASAVALAKKQGVAPPDKPLKVKAGTGYLEAYLYYLEQRAFPNDEIDLDALYNATEDRDTMAWYTGIARRLGTIDRGSRVPVPPTKWQFVGPRNLPTPYQIYYGPLTSATSGRVNGIAFHPTDSNIAYLASGGGGVWKTTDGGVNWTSIDKGFPTQNTGPVAVHPVDGNIVYVGLGDFNGGRGDGGGVMKSIDGGENWTRLDSTNTNFVRTRISALAIDPDDPNRLIAAGGRSSVAARLYVSVNAGATWTATGNVSGGTWSDVEISPVKTPATDATQPDKRFYYAVNEGNLVSRSSAGGAVGTWANINLPAVTLSNLEVATSPTNGNLVYLSNAGSDRNVYQGVRDPATDTYTWTAITTGFPNHRAGTDYYNWSQAWYDHHFSAVAQKTTTGAADTDFLYSSLITIAGKRGANNWQDIGTTYFNNAKTHNDQHSFAVFPGDKNKMLFGNDGGIYGLTYAPSTGTYTISDRLSTTLGITMFYHADFHPTNPSWAIGGAQDNATPVMRGDSGNWLNRGGGDGGGSAINPLDPQRQYATVQNGGFYYTNNGWQSTGSNDLPVADGAFTARISVDPNAPNPVYYGGNRYLHRFNVANAGNNGIWQTQLGSAFNFGSQILAITVAPADSRIIFVGTSSGALYRSLNYGANWTLINGALPSRSRTDIWVNPKNSSDVVVTLSGTGSAHVWRTANALDASPIWVSMSGSGAGVLPDTPTNSVTQDPFDSTGNTFFVATDIGVFATDNAGATWTDATAPLGLPNVTVTTLRAMPGTGYLMASTYGRGMWRIPLTASVPNLQPDLRITQTKTRSGTVRFTFTITNVGGTNSTGMSLTRAELRVGTTTTGAATTLPLTISPAAPGSSSTATVDFPLSVGTAGTSALLTIRGSYTYTGNTGTFGGTSAVTLP